MKSYTAYRAIREGTIIFGLNSGYFAGYILFVLMGGLFLAFSFSVILLFSLIILWGIVYGLLIYWSNKSGLLFLSDPFPHSITTQPSSDFDTP